MKHRPPTWPPRAAAQRAVARAITVLALWHAWPVVAVDVGQLKAAVVYNLLLFAEWPSEALAAEQPVLHLCVDPAAAPLEALLSLGGKAVGPRRLEVRKVPATPEGLRGCNAWYRDGTPPPPSSGVWRTLQRHAVLSITSGELREEGGTAIYLVEVNGRLSFDVDNAAVRQLGVQLSSKMLRLARKVHE